jgi:hypothetical protein
VLYVPCLRRRGLGAVGSIRGCGRTWSWSFPLSIGTLPTLRIIIQYGSSPSAVYLLILYTKHFQDMLRCRSEIPYQSLVSIRSLPETCSYTPNPSQPNVAGTHRIRLAVSTSFPNRRIGARLWQERLTKGAGAGALLAAVRCSSRGEG